MFLVGCSMLDIPTLAGLAKGIRPTGGKIHASLCTKQILRIFHLRRYCAEGMPMAEIECFLLAVRCWIFLLSQDLPKASARPAEKSMLANLMKFSQSYFVFSSFSMFDIQYSLFFCSMFFCSFVILEIKNLLCLIHKKRLSFTLPGRITFGTIFLVCYLLHS